MLAGVHPNIHLIVIDLFTSFLTGRPLRLPNTVSMLESNCSFFIISDELSSILRLWASSPIHIHHVLIQFKSHPTAITGVLPISRHHVFSFSPTPTVLRAIGLNAEAILSVYLMSAAPTYSYQNRPSDGPSYNGPLYPAWQCSDTHILAPYTKTRAWHRVYPTQCRLLGPEQQMGAERR